MSLLGKYEMKHLAVTKNQAIRSESRDFNSLRPYLAMLVFALAILAAVPRQMYAADADNCLMCHRFRGLARVDKDGKYRLFYVDEEIFSRGPHARVSCRGCHADIDRIPHDNAKHVDCLRACHIEEPTREILFTHESVKQTLQGSVHSSAEPNGAPRPFPGDYPNCKDCHDMPLFRPIAMFKSVSSGVSENAISRCLVCHTDENFIRYYYSHVTTRLHKARDPREVVNMCATCHGNTALAKRHNLPDVVSSYLETYHGKAVLFGSARAPDCLDCHARKGSVHEMHAEKDQRSSVHQMNRAATCGTQDCHSAAGPALASFDVHATRNIVTHPLEFGVALCFVIMTLAILLPILMINVLCLVRQIFPSRHAEEEIERLTGLMTEKIERDGDILRFTGSLRLQHAILIITFVILCLTGFPLKFASAPGASEVLGLFGGIGGAPVVHRIAGVALMIGFAVHIFLILRNVRRSLIKEGKHGIKSYLKKIQSLPMIPGPHDLRDLIALVKYVCFLSPHRPKYDRFSWKEKLEYLGLFWGIPLLGVTGLLLWAENLSSHFMPGWVLNIAFLAHTYEAILAVAHIALVHMPGVIGTPGSSLIPIMVVDGKVIPKIHAEEHGKEVERWISSEGADK